MDPNVAVILSACITALVTIVGFVVTYFLNRRNFREEVKKQKVNINLEKMAELPYKIQTLFDIMLDKAKNQNPRNSDAIIIFQELMKLVFAYGSKEAISLVSNMQEQNYTLSRNSGAVDKNELIAYYILLLCQVKYDLTGIEINPQYWYKMRLTNYTEMKVNLNGANNRIVEKLGLSKFLKAI